MKVAILCLFLAATVIANYDEAFFNRLKDTEFGVTILQTIQLEMGSNGRNTPERVLELMNQMKEDLEQEQKDEESKVSERLSGCEGRVNEADEIIKKASEKRADDERTLPLLQTEQQDKIDQSTDKAEQEQRNLDRLEALSNQRKASRAEFEERRDELMGLVSTLQEAKMMVSQLKTLGGSFLQISDPVLSEIKQHQQKFLKRYPNQRGFHALVSVMLEVLQDSGLQRSQDGVAKVVEVIQSLVESIYDVQKQELSADDQQAQAYQIQRTRLESENSRLEGTISYQRAQIELISQKILELNNDIETQTQIIESKSTEKSDWLTTCQDSEHAFNAQGQSREEQLEIINGVITAFQNFSDSLGSYISRIQTNN